MSVRHASTRQLREIRSRIGMIFQTFNLVKRTTVLNNVLMGRLHRTGAMRSLLGWYRPDDIEIAMQALERVGIVEKAYVRASDLSGGQQQRVGIARALAQQPTIILADEPVASLDPPTSHVVMRDLQRINRELGITTIINLHFLDLAKVYGERIVGLRAGELVYDGTGAQADETVFRDIYGRSLTADDLMDEAAGGPRPVSATPQREADTPAALARRAGGHRRLRRRHRAVGQRAVRHRSRHRVHPR